MTERGDRARGEEGEQDTMSSTVNTTWVQYGNEGMVNRERERGRGIGQVVGSRDSEEKINKPISHLIISLSLIEG